MKVKQIFVIAIWLTALTSLAVAQGKLKINPEDRYLLLSVRLRQAGLPKPHPELTTLRKSLR